MRRPNALRLDRLDARDQPSVFNVPWANAQQLSLSFATDGVPVAPYQQMAVGQTSSLSATLNKAATPANWQFEILKAFQTWAAPANINIGLVPDNSAAFGPDGVNFSMPAGGELRIGATAQSSEVAAITTPYHVLTGNRAGDVLLNANQSYTVGGSGGSRDIYSVLLNEAANALGMDDTTDSTSARYGRYTGVRGGISTADRTKVTGMYGARTNDALEGSGNSTFATATTVAAANPPGQPNVWIATADGSITTGDVDTYRVTARADTGLLFVRLNTAGRSLFTGTVEVFNASQQLVATQSVTNPLSGDINFAMAATPNASYFVRVRPARADVFGVGTYRLQVGLNQDPRNFPLAAPAAFVSLGADNGTKDWIASAQPLTVTTPGFAAGTRYTARAEFENGAAEHDTYSVVVPNTGKPLSVVIDPGASNVIRPEAYLYRAGYSWIDPLRLVQSPDGRFVVQSRAALTPGETVYIEVRGVYGSTGSAPYQLTVDFNTPTADTTKLAEGTAATWNTVHKMRMVVPETTFFHYTLEAWRNVVPGYGTGSRVRADILNSSGTAVTSVTADSGLNSIQAFLTAGTYTVRFTGQDSTGATAGGAWYQLRGVRLSDPIDVYDPNDTGTQTPPVTADYPEPADDSDDLWFITPPWSEPIG